MRARHQGLTPIILATWEVEVRMIMVKGQPRQTVYKTSISKIIRVEETGGVAEAVCKCKTMSSNPSSPPPSIKR
jgi:hypothetical protein